MLFLLSLLLRTSHHEQHLLISPDTSPSAGHDPYQYASTKSTTTSSTTASTSTN
jgi:hypothetical protein